MLRIASAFSFQYSRLKTWSLNATLDWVCDSVVSCMMLEVCSCKASSLAGGEEKIYCSWFSGSLKVSLAFGPVGGDC